MATIDKFSKIRICLLMLVSTSSCIENCFAEDQELLCSRMIWNQLEKKYDHFRLEYQKQRIRVSLEKIKTLLTSKDFSSAMGRTREKIEENNLKQFTLYANDLEAFVEMIQNIPESGWPPIHTFYLAEAMWVSTILGPLKNQLRLPLYDSLNLLLADLVDHKFVAYDKHTNLYNVYLLTKVVTHLESVDRLSKELGDSLDHSGLSAEKWLEVLENNWEEICKLQPEAKIDFVKIQNQARRYIESRAPDALQQVLKLNEFYMASIESQISDAEVTEDLAQLMHR